MMLKFYLFGKNFIKIFLKNSTKNKNNIFRNYDLLSIFLGFFWYGNILIVFNFFIPIKFLALILFVVILIIEFKTISEFLKTNKFSIFMMGFFIPSMYNNNPSQDANMYHFYIQEMFRSEKINLGISNFDPLYGLGSIFDYVSSTLWISSSYSLIQLLNLIFLTSFFNLLLTEIQLNNHVLKNISIAIVIIGILDNFGLGGGRNGFFFIQEIGKFDSSYAIIFFLCALLFYKVTLEKDFQSINFYLLIFFATFLSQIRTFGYLFFVTILILLFLENKIIFLIKNSGFVFFNLLWALKNLLSTGCLIYPVSFTCIETLPWESTSQTYELSANAIRNNRNPNDKNAEISSLNWIDDYWFSENIDYLLNFLLTFTLIFIFFNLFQKSQKIKRNKYSNLNTLNLLLFLISWFFLYPNYRFASGIFISIYIFFNINKISNFQLYIKNIRSIKLSILVLLIITAGLVVRVDSYKAFISNFNQNLLTKYELNTPELKKRVGSYGYSSKETYCFGELTCSNSKQKTQKNYLGSYSIYIPIKN